ncbi:MAG: hypothetical protein NZ743_06540 [Pseudomonadales bacterium]|nr:hypothetical protein [Pseudomonadales bacterium]
MNQVALDEKIRQGEKSQAVRKKLIERTPESAKVARDGKKSLAQEVVQTVDLPHPI